MQGKDPPKTNIYKGNIKGINLNHQAHVTDTLSVKKPAPRDTANRGDHHQHQHRHHRPSATENKGNKQISGVATEYKTKNKSKSNKL